MNVKPVHLLLLRGRVVISNGEKPGGTTSVTVMFLWRVVFRRVLVLLLLRFSLSCSLTLSLFSFF